jgi:NAD-dependent deacetylase
VSTDSTALSARLESTLRGLHQARLFVLTGAGISAESAIPTYRGADGVWRHVNFEEVATERAFLADQARTWAWYQERRRNVQAAVPNPAHDATVRLVRAAREGLVVTQNVDDLHERAGLPGPRLVHVHGTILSTRCHRCGNVTQADPADADKACAACGAHLLRPGVVWFDEELPRGEVERVEAFLAQGPCALVLVVGTTVSFDYIRSWALRAAGADGLIVDVNPEESVLQRLEPKRVLHLRERAGTALPALAERAEAALARG